MTFPKPRFLINKIRELVRTQYKLLLVYIYILLAAISAAYASLYLLPQLLNGYMINQAYLVFNGFIPYKQIEDPRGPLYPNYLPGYNLSSPGMLRMLPGWFI